MSQIGIHFGGKWFISVFFFPRVLIKVRCNLISTMECNDYHCSQPQKLLRLSLINYCVNNFRLIQLIFTCSPRSVHKTLKMCLDSESAKTKTII